MVYSVIIIWVIAKYPVIPVLFVRKFLCNNTYVIWLRDQLNKSKSKSKKKKKRSDNSMIIVDHNGWQ